MDSISEAFVVTDSSDRGSNCNFYDVKNGALLADFKDGSSAKKSLSFIGHDFMISADVNQPIVRIWALQSKLGMIKFIVPGMVSSLAISNCGMYCAAGIEKSLFVWEVATGTLMSHLQHHSQSVTCVKFSSDGSHILTASKDAMVLVWLLSEVVSSSESSDNVKPRFQWIDHAAEITDMYVGGLGIYSRVATVSKDMTCRIYELDTGYLLTTVHVNFALSAVVMDESEYFLFLGSSEGEIYRINMFATNKAEIHYKGSSEPNMYLGHSKEITCLSVSTTGNYLLSGSEDCHCKVWDIINFACIHTVKFEGPVTNAFFTLLPPGLKPDSQYFPRIKVSTFKRSYDHEDDIEFTSSYIQSRKLSLMHLGSPDNYFDPRVLNSCEDALAAMNKNQLSAKKLSAINSQIYSFALSQVFSHPFDNEPQMEDSD